MARDECDDLLDALDTEVLLLDVSGSVIRCNESARRLYDVPLDNGSSRVSFADLWREENENVLRQVRQIAGTSQWQPLSLIRSSGHHAGLRMLLKGRAYVVRSPEEIRHYILVQNDQGRDRGFDDHRRLIRALNMRLAEGSQTETLLAGLLDEQKKLHRELIHRVKNNLAILSSIIRINRQKSNQTEFRNLMDEMERRILSIAAVHDLLDRNQETEYVRADELIERICHELQSALSPDAVKIEHDLDPIRLHISEATPLALIINELVTNALKHAFPDNNQPGKINIALRKNGVEKLEVVIEDNGIGIPGGGDPDGSGTKITEALAMQLRGNLVRMPGSGTRWQLIFQPEEFEEAA